VLPHRACVYAPALHLLPFTLAIFTALPRLLRYLRRCLPYGPSFTTAVRRVAHAWTGALACGQYEISSFSFCCLFITLVSRHIRQTVRHAHTLPARYICQQRHFLHRELPASLKTRDRYCPEDGTGRARWLARPGSGRRELDGRRSHKLCAPLLRRARAPLQDG
jgi:hypothetical protein